MVPKMAVGMVEKMVGDSVFFEEKWSAEKKEIVEVACWAVLWAETMVACWAVLLTETMVVD